MRIENPAAQELARLTAARVPRPEPAAPQVRPEGAPPPELVQRPAEPVVAAAPEAPEPLVDSSTIQAARPRLRVDKDTSRVIAQIVNESNEVIKQIPPQEALELAARFRKVTALIFDERA